MQQVRFSVCLYDNNLLYIEGICQTAKVLND